MASQLAAVKKAPSAEGALSIFGAGQKKSASATFCKRAVVIECGKLSCQVFVPRFREYTKVVPAALKLLDITDFKSVDSRINRFF